MNAQIQSLPHLSTKEPSTKEQIMDVTQFLVQTRGYNAFSYADISKQVNIRKAAIHYYFPKKSDLGKALVARYREMFLKQLTLIDQGKGSVRYKLERYIELYFDVLQDGKMCLCGMLAAEITTLPTEIVEELNQFFDENEAWLNKLLEQGRETKTICFGGTTKDSTQFLIAGLEGAMLMARFYADATRFQSVAHRLLSVISKSD